MIRAKIGISYRRVTRSMGVLAFTWVLIAVVIVNAYNCSVISYLSANYRKPEVSTFKELAENSNFNLLNLKGSAAEYDVKVEGCSLYNISKCFILLFFLMHVPMYL